MELIGSKEEVWHTVNTYKTDIVRRDFIRDIVESFATISSQINNIDISNSEQYEDAFHVNYKDLNDFNFFRDFDEEYIETVLFDCLIKDNKVSIALDISQSILSIWQKKGKEIDFLPLLIEIEEQIRLKKNNSLGK